MTHLNLVATDVTRDKTAPTVMTGHWLANLRTLNICERSLREHGVRLYSTCFSSECKRPVIVLHTEQSVSILDLMGTENRRWIRGRMHGIYMGCDILWHPREEETIPC